MYNISIEDFDSEKAAFDFCSKNAGTTLLIPSGIYNIDGLSFPHYTRLVGNHKNLSRLSGTLIMPNTQGGLIQDLAIESIKVPEKYGLRDMEFSRVWFYGDIAVTLRGASYYNKFDMCKITSKIGFDFGEKCNANSITSCRSNCSEYHILFSGFSRGNYFRSVFEGNSNGAGVISIDGSENIFISCWYERYKSNKWKPSTIILSERSFENLIIAGAKCYLFSIIDKGIGNVIIPSTRDPMSYK